MKAPASPARAQVVTSGRTLGFFIVLALLAILPNRFVISLVVGATLYLLLLTLQSRREQRGPARTEETSASPENAHASTRQPGQGQAIQESTVTQTVAYEQTPCLSTDAMKAPGYEAAHGDGGASRETSNDADSSTDCASTQISSTARCTREHRPVPGNSIEPSCQQTRVHPDARQLTQQMFSKKQEWLQCEQTQVRLLTAEHCMRVEAPAQYFNANHGAPDSQIPIIGAHLIGDGTTMMHPQFRSIYPLRVPMAGVPSFQPACVSGNVTSPSVPQKKPSIALSSNEESMQCMECWNWKLRGWCPRGASCQWEHPREKEDGHIYWANVDSSGGAYFGTCDRASNTAEGPKAATGVDDGIVKACMRDRASTHDTDDCFTDDGF